MCFVIKIKHYAVFIFKKTFEKHVDLLLLLNTKNLHYVLIKGFNRFMTNKTKHHCKNHSC